MRDGHGAQVQIPVCWQDREVLAQEEQLKQPLLVLGPGARARVPRFLQPDLLPCGGVVHAYGSNHVLLLFVYAAALGLFPGCCGWAVAAALW